MIRDKIDYAESSFVLIFISITTKHTIIIIIKSPETLKAFTIGDIHFPQPCSPTRWYWSGPTFTHY